MAVVLHLDMDCFFVAVELKYRPELANRPVAVGGPALERGVLATTNYLARKKGVFSGMSTKLAVKKCPELVLLPPNFSRYQDASRDVFNIVAEFNSHISQMGLDEGYLLFSNASFDDVEDAAKMMQHRIESETGLTCSIGIAPNAFLAKICSDWKKPKGFFTLRPHEVAPFLEQIPLKSIPGVGPTTLKSLNAIGIKNLQQIRHFDFPLLEQTLGKFAFDLKNFAYGIDQRDLWAQEARKNLSVEHTYIQDLVRPLEWKSAIEDLFPVLEGRLNRYRTRENDQRSISGIVLKLKFHDFENRTLSCSLGPKNQPSPPSSPLIKEKFYLLLEQAIKRWENRPLRLLGIGVVFQKDTHQESQSEDDHIQIQNSLFEFGLGDLKN